MRGIMIRALFLLCVFCNVALAQTVENGSVATQQVVINEARVTLDRVIVRLQQGDDRSETLDALRGELNQLQGSLAQSGTILSTPLAEVRAQLEKLGAPPAAGQTEDSAVAAQRKRLTARANQISDINKQLDLLRFETDQTAAKISERERARFYNRIFTRDRSILDPSLWGTMLGGTASLLAGVATLVEVWWRTRGGLVNPTALLIIPLAIAIFWFAWRTIRRRYFIPSQPNEDAPATSITTLGRLTRVFWRLIAIVLACFVATTVVLLTAEAANVSTPQFEALLLGLAILASAVVIHSALAWLITSPSRPDLRLISVDNRAARTLPIVMGVAAFAASLSSATDQIVKHISMPVNFSAGQSAISAMIMIAAIAVGLLTIRRQANLNDRGSAQEEQVETLTTQRTYFLEWFPRLLPFLWLLIGIAALGLLLGFISLSYFVVHSMLTSVVILLLAGLIHYFADAVAEAAHQPSHVIGRSLSQGFGLSETAVARIALVFRTVVDVLIAIVALPLLLSTWTSSWISLSSLYQAFSNGFTFGSIRLSPWSLLLGILVITIGVALTRIVTRWLNSRVLTETSLDKGVQDSVRTAASYTGYIIAGALGLSVAGLDFSNIAIVAGALGVGIGFGLQSIVNNFVSGLILLAERPVRVGDWVVTTAGEGIVKKINVRSTEIETFDNCTVIVPNSNLITEAVRNWTHRDRIGRFNVPVTVVSSTTKIDEVVELLTDLARAHPKVLRYPEPQTQLTELSLHGLKFELKGHVADVFTGGQVASDLRLSIAKELSARKIQLATLAENAKGRT
jgi:potassium-dependent mechanosensitive channel